MKDKEISEVLQDFLNDIEKWKNEYQAAEDFVKKRRPTSPGPGP